MVRGGVGLPGSKLEPMLRSEPLDSAIPTIPYGVIAAFLDRPGVISKDEVKQAPYVLALRDEHDIAGAGDELYVKKLDAQTTGARYAVMHVDEPLNDPKVSASSAIWPSIPAPRSSRDPGRSPR